MYGGFLYAYGNAAGRLFGPDAFGRARDAFGAQGLGKACARARTCTGRQHGGARAINSREMMAVVMGFHLEVVLLGSSSSERSVV